MSKQNTGCYKNRAALLESIATVSALADVAATSQGASFWLARADELTAMAGNLSLADSAIIGEFRAARKAIYTGGRAS